MTLAPGTKLGPYEVQSSLGAGGMGEVYKAKDTRLDRVVAIKLLPEEFFEDKERRERFEREAKALAAVNHPNIAAVYSFEEASGRHLLVHELLEGRTLRAALADGALPVRGALEIAEKIAQGLAAAHEKGIVHRDLKPENVFLTADGSVKILDFGLARREAAASGPEDTKSPTLVKLTDPGVVFGTVAYMSPEQARGGAVDFRTDQFSLGVVLFEMLAGQRPFDRPSQAETMAAIIREEPAPLAAKAPAVPAPVRWIVEGCLSKEPSERYAATRDLARDLTSCRQHLSEAIPGPVAAPPVRPVWQSRTALVLGVVAAIALAFLAGRMTLRKGGTSDGTARARQFRRLTSLPGAEMWPALSPDGETLAYVKEITPGKADIFVQRIGGQAAINLTKDHLGNYTQPAFSPDGSRIAFRSDRDGGGLFIMGVMGESVRRLTDFGFLPAWFPDGRKIAFSSGSFSSPYIGGGQGGKGALWTVNVGTGEKEALLNGDAMEPSVSPHGLRIAYWTVVAPGSHRDIYTIPASGLRPGESAIPAVQGPATNWSPFWSPDGRYLCFGSDRDGTLNLWRIPIDEQSGRPLGEPEPIAVPAWHGGPFSASADGRRIAFESVEDEFAIEAIPLDPSSGATAGEPRSVLKTNIPLLTVSVSPRGDALAFSTWGLEEDLWIVRSDGTGLRKVTDDRYRDRVPFFSPDGKRLAFHSDRDGTWNIWTIGVDGSGLTQITADKASGFPLSAQFSPDGTKLSVASYTGTRIIPSDIRPGARLPEPLPLPENGIMFRPFCWFPDGGRLAGFVWKPGAPGAGIMTLDIASQKYERLTESGGFPALTADGRRLYYLDEGKVWLIDPATKKPRLIFEGTAERPVIHQTVAPDGRSLYVIRQFDQSDIWLLDSR